MYLFLLDHFTIDLHHGAISFSEFLISELNKNLYKKMKNLSITLVALKFN